MNDPDMCRFCHELIELPKEIEQVISPCRCRGSQELVHIECFNKWGKTKCEVCKFRYYAGEIPQPPPLEPGPDLFENIDITINFNLPEQIEDDPVPEPIDVPEIPPEITNMLNIYSNLIPEHAPNGFRTRTFWYMTTKLMMQLKFVENMSLLKKLYEITSVYLWSLNEIYKIKSKRITILLSTLLMIGYCIFGLILSPLLYFYHIVKSIRVLTLFSLFSFVLFVDLIRHIMNLYMRDYYYPTGIQMIIDGVCMITNKPCSSINLYHLFDNIENYFINDH